jgi:DNA invertase Pin-like site-specific DNA recombinase
MAHTVRRFDRAASSGPPVNVVRYLRVSRLGDRILGDEAFHSPELQIGAIDREFDSVFGGGGWQLAAVAGSYGQATFADFDVSGTSDARAGLEDAIEAAKRCGVEAVGVLNLSRWARNVLGALHRVEELEASGAVLISAKERADFKTPEGRFVTTLYLAIAELYAGQKGEEWAGIIEHRTSKLGSHHGRAPTGYVRLAGPDGKPSGDLVADPDAASDVQEAFRLMDAGLSRMAVGRMLRDRGRLSSSSQVMSILTNRAYLRLHDPQCTGTRCHRIDPHGDRAEVRSWELEEQTRRKKRRVGETWHPARHEGIVDVELFDRVQLRLAGAARLNQGRAERRRADVLHELAGVVRCAYCFRALACDAGRGRSTRVTLRDNSGRDMGCRGPGMVTADGVLEVVLDHLRAVVGRLDNDSVERATQLLTSESPRRARPKTAGLAKRRERALLRLGELGTAVALGDYPGSADEAEAVIARLRDEVARLDSELAEATRVGPPRDTEGPRKAMELLTQWDEMDVTARNAMLRELVTVYVGRRDPDGAWRQPYATRSSVRFRWET